MINKRFLDKFLSSKEKNIYCLKISLFQGKSWKSKEYDALIRKARIDK